MEKVLRKIDVFQYFCYFWDFYNWDKSMFLKRCLFLIFNYLPNRIEEYKNEVHQVS